MTEYIVTKKKTLLYETVVTAEDRDEALEKAEDLDFEFISEDVDFEIK